MSLIIALLCVFFGTCTTVIAESQSDLTKSNSVLSQGEPAPKTHGQLLAAASPRMTEEKTLSADAGDLAQKLGILPKLVELEKLRQNQSNPPTDSETLRLMVAKQDLIANIMDYEYDVTIAGNKVESEIDQANDKYAFLAERRDRAIRLNTYANFISGGITGMVSGALNLGVVNYIAPNTLDTVEGVVQTTLATWGMQQLRGERKIERGVPNLLSKMLTPQGVVSEFPESVGIFLDSVPSNSLTGETRRKALVTYWMKAGFGTKPKRLRTTQEDRMHMAAGIHGGAHRLTVHVLEDRMAMLMDLQTAIVSMESLLQEYLQVVRGTRSVGTF